MDVAYVYYILQSNVCKYTYLRYILLVCIVYMYCITLSGVIDTNTNTRVVSSVEVCNMCLQIIVILYTLSVIIPRLQHTIVTAVMFRRTVCEI